MTAIKNLLKNISEFDNKEKHVTIFDMIGNGNSETMHSSMIGFLLNPKAHSKGLYCLQEFIDFLTEKRNEAILKVDSVQVSLEYDLGKIEINERPTGGRIDIFLEDSDNNVVVIENKIFAPDQPCQLLRYKNSLQDKNKNHTIVYLTLNGKKPSNYSLGIDFEDVAKPLDVSEIICLSYSEILHWLHSIQKDCDPTLAHNIEQYKLLINKLIMEEKIIQSILSSGEAYESAVRVSRCMDDARMELKRKFLGDLRNSKLLGFPNYKISPLKENGKIVYFTIELANEDYIDIAIDWRLYISYPKKNSWKYIGQKDEFNFYECSDSVKEYLTNRENARNNIIEKVSKIIIDSVLTELG